VTNDCHTWSDVMVTRNVSYNYRLFTEGVFKGAKRESEKREADWMA